MASYAIIRELGDNDRFSSQPWAAMKYDGQTMLLIGDDEFMESWHTYFSNTEGDWWTQDRFVDSPFSKFVTPMSGWEAYTDPDGEDEFLTAMSRLGGKKMKSIEYPGG